MKNGNLESSGALVDLMHALRAMICYVLFNKDYNSICLDDLSLIIPCGVYSENNV